MPVSCAHQQKFWERKYIGDDSSLPSACKLSLLTPVKGGRTS